MITLFSTTIANTDNWFIKKKCWFGPRTLKFSLLHGQNILDSWQCITQWQHMTETPIMAWYRSKKRMESYNPDQGQIFNNFVSSSPTTFHFQRLVESELNLVCELEINALTCEPSANTKTNHSRDLLSTRLLWIHNKMSESMYVVSKNWKLNKPQW